MKKNYHTALILLLPFVALQAYAQSWQWGKGGGSYQSYTVSGYDEHAKSLVTDLNGNVYVMAPVGSTGLKIDGIEKEGYYVPDIMIAGFSCSGAYRWSRVIGGGGQDLANQLQTDNQGSVYVSGLITRTQNTPGYFGTETNGVYDTILPYSSYSTNTNKQRLFLVKYNSEGTMQWLRMPQAADVTYDNASLARSYGLNTDAQGNSHWLVSIPTGTYADGAFVNNNEGYSLFMFKYDASGNFIQAIPLAMQLSAYDSTLKIKRNPATGNYYIYSYTSADFTTTINGDQLPVNKAYIAVFDEEGNLVWVKTGTAGISDIAIDTDNSLYLTGGTATGNSFADHEFTSQYADVFPLVMKLTDQGTLVWATNAETQSANGAAAITLNGNEVAITGSHAVISWQGQTLTQESNEGYDVLLARFNKANGTLIEMTDIEGNFGFWDYGTSITADLFGNYYLGGKFGNFLYVNDDTTLVNGAQGTDFFVAKYGTDNCDCALPVPGFGFTEDSQNSLAYTFNYTGTAYDTINWDFGDGQGTASGATPAYTYAEPGEYNVCVTVGSACGEVQYCSAVSATLGTKENSLLSISVHPNPAENILYINNPDMLNYTLFTLLGSKVLSGTLQANGSIDTGNIQNGIYLLQLHGNDGTVRTIKVIKE